MRERPEDGATRPIARSWLPDSRPPEGDPEWDQRIERIMSAARPELRRLESRSSAVHVTWWSGIGMWWKPAAALAAASTTLLLLVGRAAVITEPPPGMIPLELVASQGDPVMLWGALGIEANPVLALIAFQKQGDVSKQGSPPIIPNEDDR